MKFHDDTGVLLLEHPWAAPEHRARQQWRAPRRGTARPQDIRRHPQHWHHRPARRIPPHRPHRWAGQRPQRRLRHRSKPTPEPSSTSSSTAHASRSGTPVPANSSPSTTSRLLESRSWATRNTTRTAPPSRQWLPKCRRCPASITRPRGISTGFVKVLWPRGDGLIWPIQDGVF